MAKKDRVRPLFDLISGGDSARIRTEANRQLREISEELVVLKRDASLIKDLVNRYGGTADGMSSQDRSEKIRAVALILAGREGDILTPQDVLDHLQTQEGITFDVQRPGSVVGTVLNNMDEFERLEKNRFRHSANHVEG